VGIKIDLRCRRWRQEVAESGGERREKMKEKIIKKWRNFFIFFYF